MNAGYVSMVGNPNSTSLDDYVQVLRYVNTLRILNHLYYIQ